MEYSTNTGAEGLALFIGVAMFYLLISLPIIVLMIAGLWKIFTKAGKPGWAALIPFYSLWVLAEVAGKPGWWGIAVVAVNFIPFIGAVISIVLSLIIAMELAKKFDKGPLFGVVGLWLFPFIGYPMLGFGSAAYENTSTLQPETATPNGVPEIFGQPNQPVNTPYTDPSNDGDSTPPSSPTPPTTLVQ